MKYTEEEYTPTKREMKSYNKRERKGKRDRKTNGKPTKDWRFCVHALYCTHWGRNTGKQGNYNTRQNTICVLEFWPAYPPIVCTALAAKVAIAI